MSANVLPDEISLEVHRDRNRPVERCVRWLVVVAIAIVVGLGLANTFGQRPVEAKAESNGASLAVSAPIALRSGLIFQGRFRIAAGRALTRPTLVLERGWLESLTINTIEPAPVDERGDAGAVALEFPPLGPGRTLTVYVQFQVNPTTVAARSQDVELRDGARLLTRIDRSVTIFP